MSAVYTDIVSSLDELHVAAMGTATGIVVHARAIKEVESFSPQQIKEIRINSNMTQKTFAACIGVSAKSVEAWEGGSSRPDGAARRLLGLMKEHPDFAEKMGIYV